MANEGDRLKLAGRYFAIALLPALMFFINLWLLAGYAEPPDVLPARIAEFAAYKEATARISVLAAMMLFAGAAVAALLFFAVSMRAIESRQRWVLIACLVALALAAAVSGNFVRGKTAVDYAGSSLTQLSAGYDQVRSDAARAAEKRRVEAEAKRPPATDPARPQPKPAPAAMQLPNGVAVGLLPRQDKQAQSRFAAMTALQRWQFEATTFAFAALIMAAILCLAGPVPRSAAASGASPSGSAPAAAAYAPSAAADELQHWEQQSERLNYCLYLSALLLGTSLLFINAFLSWPGYVLTEHADYDAYIRTLVAYYGFTFTVMLASFYIPVAAILTARVKALSATTQGPNAFQGPLQILKIVLGLFSTSLAGVLPALIDKL